MSEKKIRDIIAFIRGYFKNRRFKINKIVLFGSYGSKRFSKDSDVDIAIISSDFDDKDIFQRAKMLQGLQWSLVKRFLLPFDIVPLSTKELEYSSSMIVEFVRQGRQVAA